MTEETRNAIAVLKEFINVLDDEVVDAIDTLIRSVEADDAEVAKYADELEQIVWKINNDERHDYPDPCIVCEANDLTFAVVEKMRKVAGVDWRGKPYGGSND